MGTLYSRLLFPTSYKSDPSIPAVPDALALNIGFAVDGSAYVTTSVVDLLSCSDEKPAAVPNLIPAR